MTTARGLTNAQLARDYAGHKQMSSPIKKKKLDYPDETGGSRMAARLRKRGNKMTSAQREECLKKAMQIYIGF